MTDYSAVITTLQACLNDIQIFQQRYDAESAKAQRNQQKQQAYNNAKTAWDIANQQQLALREAGRRAPDGYIWYNGSLSNCSTNE